MKKSHLDALGKVFTAEITDSLPFQSKAKIYRELEALGFVQPMTRTFGKDGFGRVFAKGYELTHAGRYTYCASCEEVWP